MSLDKVTKRYTDYKSKANRIPIHSKELNTVIDQVNTNITGISGTVSSTSTNTSAIAAILAGTALTTTNIGAAATGTTAVEYGDGLNHTTVLTVATAFGAIVGGTDLSLGKLVYTLPAGAIGVKLSYMSLALQQTEGNVTADTPEVGVGTTIGAGAVAVLGGTAGFENIIEGTAAADCDGTATVLVTGPTAGIPLPIHSANPHIVHINIADGWAASGDAALGVTGTIVLEWTFFE